MSTDQPTATATPVYRFSLASWLSIYGRTCLMDFVKETDYATLERALAEAKREATAQGEHAVAMTEHAQSLQAALAKAKAEVAEIRKNHGGLLLLMAERDQLRARVAELDTDNCRLINKVDVQAVELHKLEATIVTLSGQCTSLFNERETLLVDRGCMDWLETQTVEVRSPLNHGSRELFCVSPIRGDGEERPSRLRAAIDAAKGQP